MIVQNIYNLKTAEYSRLDDIFEGMLNSVGNDYCTVCKTYEIVVTVNGKPVTKTLCEPFKDKRTRNAVTCKHHKNTVNRKINVSPLESSFYKQHKAIDRRKRNNHAERLNKWKLTLK